MVMPKILLCQRVKASGCCDVRTWLMFGCAFGEMPLGLNAIRMPGSAANSLKNPVSCDSLSKLQKRGCCSWDRLINPLTIVWDPAVLWFISVGGKTAWNSISSSIQSHNLIWVIKISQGKQDTVMAALMYQNPLYCEIILHTLFSQRQDYQW